MNVAILDDYQDTIRTLACFSKVAGHQVTIWREHTKDVDVLAERLLATEALALLGVRGARRPPVHEPDARPALLLHGRADVGHDHRRRPPHPPGEGRAPGRAL